MSIADKLTTVTENVEKVYNAGYEKGKSEGGGNGVNDAIVNNTTHIRFNDDDWLEGDTLEVNVPKLNSLAASFYFLPRKLKNLIITSNTPILEANDTFYRGDASSTLEKIVFNCDFSKCTTFVRFSLKHFNLKTIEGNPINFSSATQIGGIFNYAYALQSLRIVPNTIKVNISFDTNSNLDDTTIQNIIDGLADLTGGTAKTIALHKNVKAKLTETQIASITSKNWTLA